MFTEKTNWITVKEEMPKDGQRINVIINDIVWNEPIITTATFINDDTGTYFLVFCQVTTETDITKTEEILAWSPNYMLNRANDIINNL